MEADASGGDDFVVLQDRPVAALSGIVQLVTPFLVGESVFREVPCLPPDRSAQPADFLDAIRIGDLDRTDEGWCYRRSSPKERPAPSRASAR
jgi:hypothetical protein